MRDFASVAVRQILAPILRRVRPHQSRLPAEYFLSRPSSQNALDIFADEWYTSLPPEYGLLRAGKHDLWRDPRISWGLAQMGDLTSRGVLELGPLEGAHTYMLQKAGCASIKSIEGNPRAFLKCLVLKEILGLDRAQFLCGDFNEYLRAAPPKVDAVIASGVLYHMTSPVELLYLISCVTDSLFLWSHYYDEAVLARKADIRKKLSAKSSSEFQGFRYNLFRYEYWSSFGLRRFYGGPKPFAYWLERKTILECLRWCGFTSIVTGFEEPDHPDGPALALVARRE